MNRILSASLLMVLSLPALGYSVQVNKVSEFHLAFNTLAMLPASGPSGFDTIWLENVLVEKLSARGMSVIPAVIVRQAMFDLGISELTDESRKTLAQKVGADAFVVAAVDAVATENAGSVGIVVAGLFIATPSDKNTGSVQLAIMAADSGKVLMQGVGHGQSEVRSKRGVIGKTFDRILDRVFTPQFRKIWEARQK